jgi:hypothetical protein
MFLLYINDHSGCKVGFIAIKKLDSGSHIKLENGQLLTGEIPKHEIALFTTERSTIKAQLLY